MGATQDGQETAEPQLMDLSQVPLPGELVRKAREVRGIAADEFCRQSRLTLNVLRAVESDDYARLGEPVYARGYFRKCAEVLGLNGDLLVDAYEKRSGTMSPVPLINQRPSIAYREHTQWLQVLAFTALICAVLGLGSWWWQSQGEQTVSTVTPAAVESTDFADDVFAPSDSDIAQTAVAPVNQGASSELELAEDDDFTDLAMQATPRQPAATASPAVRVVSPTPVAVAAPTTAPKPVVVATPAPTPAPVVAQSTEHVLSVELRGGDSWTEVTDSTGRVLIYKLLRQGEVHQVLGTPPYEIYMGRADQVNISLNGQAVDFKGRIQPTLKARFTVDGQGRVGG